MKLLIAVDMEGITGVSRWPHVDSTHAEYQRFRKLMTGDVNAAVAGAFSELPAGSEVVVADGHGSGQNILIDELDSRARLHSGNAAPFAMVHGIGTDVDAVFFVGYHARMGSTPAVLDHTWSSSHVFNVWLNGRITGEIGLNASLSGHYGAPVLMISSDQTAAAEAREWVPGIETAVVKVATSRYSAEALPPAVSGECIRSAAATAIRKFLDGSGPKPLQPGSPVTVAVEFFNSAMADGAALTPGAKRLDARKVEIETPNMPAAYWAFRTLTNMADR